MKLIKQGAEAKLFLDDGILVKERISKGYRIEEIDFIKRKYPTRKEAKLLDKALKIGVNVPKLIEVDDEKMIIKMDFIDGRVLNDVFDELESKERKNVLEVVGQQIALMHDNQIIHGDLTTSNIILGDKIYFIDFGLGFISDKIEDMAVDLYLLKQVFKSKHYEIESSFDEVLKGYKKSKNYLLVLKRMEAVEGRGRYKKN